LFVFLSNWFCHSCIPFFVPEMSAPEILMLRFKHVRL
jgi:hypothetical protein